MNRATYACARCFRQKRKCDSQSPCTRCLQAGVECVGLDRATATPVPRSVAQYLEQKIASLESELGLDKNNEDEQATGSGTPRPRQTFDQQIHTFAASIAAETFSRDEILSTAFIGALTSSSPLPHSAILPEQQVEAAPPDLSTVTSIDVSSIPRHVAEVLVRVYVDKILPQYPYFFPEQIHGHFESMYAGAVQAQHPLPRVSKYIISMIMAVSAMTSKAVDFEKPMAFSDALFYGAMQHYDALKANTLEALQATMLICQFATFRPATANIWRAKDIAMRMAIGLGLHRQPKGTWHTLDAEAIKLRASIFWVLYAMDRSFGVPTMRPLGIADEHIDAKFPAECLEVEASESVNADAQTRRRDTHWLNHVRLRQLQSEVYGINFGTANIRFPSYQDWMSDMDRRLRLWKQNVDVENFSETGPDWFDFVMSTIQFYLHNPCPRNPKPSEASLLICFEAASTTLHGYYGLMKSGFLKFDWHSGQQCFPNSIFVMEHGSFFVRNLSLARVNNLLDQYSECFIHLARRWPATIILSQQFEARRALFQASINSSGLYQTLGAVSEEQTPMMEAITFDLPNFDDTDWWGPLDDNYQAFMDLDWNMMGGYDDINAMAM